MTQPIEDGLRALQWSLESRLFNYQYEASAKTLIMVLDYPEKVAGSTLAFLRLRFMDVSEFHRIPGPFPELNRFKESFSRRGVVGTTVVQWIDIKKKSDSLSISLDLGNFGHLVFVCQSLSAEVRNTRKKWTNEKEFDFYDFDDDKLIDVDDPFA